ncbi:hypothetical protein [Streptomyces cavernicola]|uniref:Secreted protein n=1 Tax=Streptomyces cavernicola TaxID=3043613 RepID=A0ABT6SCV4_9ACTN|nr:hypothetical protein [Streptomyces sp. B-S-A6]MDI3406032.1 hypothetical protein [Streptomyces sp. B-S-A6]
MARLLHLIVVFATSLCTAVHRFIDRLLTRRPVWAVARPRRGGARQRRLVRQIALPSDSGDSVQSLKPREV